MVHLGEKCQIEITMMIGYGNRVRTHKVCNIFNDLHPKRNQGKHIKDKHCKVFMQLVW